MNKRICCAPAKFVAQEAKIFDYILLHLSETFYIAKFAEMFIDISFFSIEFRPETIGIRPETIPQL